MDLQQWRQASTEFHEVDWPSEVPDLVRLWAQSRGYSDYQEFTDFYQFKLKDLTDPLKLKDMDKACERLVQAFKDQEKICIYADYDMDGTPGLALLLRGLKNCGFTKLTYFQPNRFEHGYGVHPEIVADFIEQGGVQLFVTVDVGITDVKAVARAKELGADFVITDHHQAKEEVPEAYAIVNPNQPACESGLTYLCGTGVAFYLILALRRRLKEEGLLPQDFDPKSLLDCFAIGTLTDMVPIVKDNRVLVQHGLRQLRNTNIKGLQLLMDELKLTNQSLSGQDVAIRLSPKLNALGRMNSEVNAIDIFLVDDEDQASQFVKEVLQSNDRRIDIQKKGELLIDDYLHQIHELNHAFVFSEHFHKGVVGLLAAKILNRYNIPTLVGTVVEDKIVGSARAPEGSNILAALETASPFLTKFGGHKQAAGFELRVEDAENFAASLHQHFSTVETPSTRIVEYDFDCELNQLNPSVLQWMKQLEPLGMGFEPPTMHFKNLFVASTKTLKEIHLKLVLKDIQGQSIEGLWFNVENIEAMKKLTSQRVRILGELSRNEYMGREKLQLLIRDLKTENI